MRYLDDMIESENSINLNKVVRKLEFQKHLHINGQHKIIFAEIFARFYCNFTKPEHQTFLEKQTNGWLVDFLKIVDFDILYYEHFRNDEKFIK